MEIILLERIEKLATHLPGEGVQALGSMEGQREDPVLDRIENLLVCHRALLRPRANHSPYDRSRRKSREALRAILTRKLELRLRKGGSVARGNSGRASLVSGLIWLAARR